VTVDRPPRALVHIIIYMMWCAL